jgi:hypothetical protein
MTPALLVAALLLGADPEARSPYFSIKVVDSVTGRGVPLVELRMVDGTRYYTDSNGIAAIHEPGFEGKDVFFHVSSHGYEFPKDGFGYRGKALRIVPGGHAELKIQRINIAERLYRITGGGIYRDSVLIGVKVPIEKPLLNGLVFGSDSVLNAEYRGELYWFWGDTNRPRYPLGNFQVTGATSPLSTGAASGINLRYFINDDGFARPMTRIPGKGPTWLTTVVPLADRDGKQRLYGSYVKVEPPLTVYARGLAVFDDAVEWFTSVLDIPLTAPVFPDGHVFRHTENGVEHVYFANPFPLTRVQADAEHFLRPNDYEMYTCLLPGSTTSEPRFDRDEAGGLRCRWRKSAPVLGPVDEAKLLAKGILKPADGRWQLQERDSGKRVTPHAGSVYWNDYRRRWIMITVQTGGTSFLGEVWYAEADTPVGPWSYAVKIVTHDRYSFYNPKQHPYFGEDGGRLIYFEGTYTHTFSGNPEQTPRYDYNQIMYRLDLADPRLAPARQDR